MATLATIISNSREDLKIDPGKQIWTDSQLTRWANEGISFMYSRSDFKFEFKETTITPLVDGTASYAFATDFRKMLWAKLVDTTAASTGADESRLTIVTDTLTDFQQTHDMDYKGDIPAYIYEESGTLKLWPVPNASAAAKYTVKYKYTEYPDVYTALEVPAFPTEWHFVIEHYIRYRAWSELPGAKNEQKASTSLEEWNMWSAKAVADMLDREQEKLTFRPSVVPSKRRK